MTTINSGPVGSSKRQQYKQRRVKTALNQLRAEESAYWDQYWREHRQRVNAAIADEMQPVFKHRQRDFEEWTDLLSKFMAWDGDDLREQIDRTRFEYLRPGSYRDLKLSSLRGLKRSIRRQRQQAKRAKA
jgi:hypothetical protein